MANLDVIVKELQQERDRLDKAITALTSLNGTRPKQTPKTYYVSFGTPAHCYRAAKALGSTEERRTEFICNGVEARR